MESAQLLLFVATKMTSPIAPVSLSLYQSSGVQGQQPAIWTLSYLEHIKRPGSEPILQRPPADKKKKKSRTFCCCWVITKLPPFNQKVWLSWKKNGVGPEPQSDFFSSFPSPQVSSVVWKKNWIVAGRLSAALCEMASQLLDFFCCYCCCCLLFFLSVFLITVGSFASCCSSTKTKSYHCHEAH